MGPQVGISFAIFSYLQPKLLHYLEHCDEVCQVSPANRYSPQNILVSSAIVGCVAGTIAKSITYPLDLAKRRLQVGASTIL